VRKDVKIRRHFWKQKKGSVNKKFANHALWEQLMLFCRIIPSAHERFFAAAVKQPQRPLE